MTKKIKGLIILFIFSFIMIPNNALALTTDYKSINENVAALTDGYSGLEFATISFKQTENDFGLTGMVHNGNEYDIRYTSTVTYYDLNYNLIATAEKRQTLTTGLYTSYNHMSNKTEINNNYTIEDIAYYKLEINVTQLPTKNNEYQNSNYDYILKSYDINMIVNENNTIKITERIEAYFNIDKHGIFRKIPLKNKITRLDGTSSMNRVKISEISVNEKYSLYTENGYKVIKIGDPNYTLKGKKNYTISYLYNLGKDTGRGYDELYFNIIGDEWDTTISNITFTITMPKEFDKTKLGFSSGPKGSTDSSKVIFNINENVITGRLNKTLNPEEALTIRLELPEGYFINSSNNFDLITILSLFLPILFVFIAYIIWRKYGKEDEVIETVEFYPPEGFNSLEIGFLYNGIASDQDVVSLLIYLANKGYIKITEYEGKSLFTKTKEFKITKLKEYDGNNINELIFLNGLFKKKPKISFFINEDKQNINDNIDNNNKAIEVTSEDLYDNFYVNVRKILANINNKENKNKIFEKTANKKTGILILMIIATFCLITIPPVLEYQGASMLFPAILFPGIGFTVLFILVFGKSRTVYVNGKPKKSALGSRIFGLIWGGMFGGIPWAFMVLPSLLYDSVYLVIYIIGLLCVSGILICLNYLSKRTPYGNQILGKLRGFKNFLETAEKDNLEAMVMKNPNYFYDILPYTYVLGVSDTWINKFEKITLQAPSWYDSPNGFNHKSFSTFMNNTMTKASQTMSSHSSSSGGSSGGGSSGGGSGGGGGGSW